MPHAEVSFKDYFTILEISPFASMDVIQAAYRALARLYHPDTQRFTIGSNKTMVDINEAYAVLSDPIKREEYWELFLQENIKKENSRGQQYYFYKNWEESLKKREQELSEKSVQVYEKLNYSEESLQYIKRFNNASGYALKAILAEIRDVAQEIQVEFLEQIILSSYLSLEAERELLLWILEFKKPNAVPFIAKAFKYKDLYPLLFSYIDYYHIQDYWDKILLIAQHIELKTTQNIFLAIEIIDMNWPPEKKESLLQIIQDNWFKISYWSRIKKEKEFQNNYKILKEKVRQLKA